VLLVSPVLSYYSVQRHGLNRIMASILDNVPDLISYVDTDQRLRFSNRAHRSVLGVRSPEIYGRSLREILGDAAYDVLRPRLDEVLGGRPVTFDTRLVYGGQARDLSIAYMPDAGHGGALRGFVAVESDVTALRDAERRERERMLELAHAGRLACVGEMATQIAHEVNQPLTAIVTYCAAVKHGLGAQQADRSRVGEWLDAIGAQAHRVGDTIRRLRDFVRKGGMTLAPMDLGEVVADAVRMIQPGANRQGVLVAVEPSSSLPEVFADRVLLTQAVLNLVRNAVDAAAASPPDRRLVRVVTAAAPAGVEVRVIDSGPGLAAELEDRLFEPFATTKDGGLGLGLPIARSIVEAHGGEIGYSPAEGGDTCFTLTLPARTR
jgi:PAS domain S-box-containing protein